MPWDEWDAEDPYELTGVLLPTSEDTSLAMAETFIEEFLRLGYGARQVQALFRNPHYRGPYTVWRKHGDGFVKEVITRVFLRWGRVPDWAPSGEAQAAACPRKGAPGVSARAASGDPRIEAAKDEGEKAEL